MESRESNMMEWRVEPDDRPIVPVDLERAVEDLYVQVMDSGDDPSDSPAQA